MKDTKGQRAKYNYVQLMADLQKDADQRGQIEGAFRSYDNWPWITVQIYNRVQKR